MVSIKIILAIISILLLSSPLTPAQNFKVGAKLEIFGIVDKKVRDYQTNNTKFVISPAPSIHLSLNYKLSDSYSISLMPGVLFSFLEEDFSGYDLTIFGSRSFEESHFFIEAGINLHLNGGVSHGTSWYSEASLKLIPFLFAGGGLKLSDVASVDITFHLPLINEYGYDSISGDVYNVSGPKLIYFMTKIGFQVLF